MVRLLALIFGSVFALALASCGGAKLNCSTEATASYINGYSDGYLSQQPTIEHLQAQLAIRNELLKPLGKVDSQGNFTGPAQAEAVTGGEEWQK